MVLTDEIADPAQKSRICNDVLRSLPDWFGVEESIARYAEDCRGMPFYAAYAEEGGGPIGFAAIKTHNRYTIEVCVMGVLRPYHRMGAGRALIGRCEEYGRGNGMEFLTVKTLDGSRADEGYERTRLFYLAMGFRPLEVFPAFWDEANPCLFLAKHIYSQRT